MKPTAVQRPAAQRGEPSGRRTGRAPASLAVLLLLLSFLTACANDSLQHEPTFAVFAVKRGTMGGYPTGNPPPTLDELQLDGSPMFTDRDIVRYDAHTHVATLTPPARERFLHDMSAIGVATAFVVVADGRRQYRGPLISGLSSSSGPGICVTYPVALEDEHWNDIQFSYGYPPGLYKPPAGGDPLLTQDVVRALRSAGKLVE
jgi:hypothetical protein